MASRLPDGPTTATAPDVAVRVRDVLDRACYGESRILQLLGLTSWPSFRQRGEALPLYIWRTRGGTPLDVLVRLFLLQQPVPLDAARRALAPMHPDEWAAVDLLRRDGDEVRAAVELCPYQGLVAAADWPGKA